MHIGFLRGSPDVLVPCRAFFREKKGEIVITSSNLLIPFLRSIYNNGIDCNKMRKKEREIMFFTRKDHKSRLLCRACCYNYVKNTSPLTFIVLVLFFF